MFANSSQNKKQHQITFYWYNQANRRQISINKISSKQIDLLAIVLYNKK